MDYQYVCIARLSIEIWIRVKRFGDEYIARQCETTLPSKILPKLRLTPLQIPLSRTKCYHSTRVPTIPKYVFGYVLDTAGWRRLARLDGFQSAATLAGGVAIDATWLCHRDLARLEGCAWSSRRAAATRAMPDKLPPVEANPIL